MVRFKKLTRNLFLTLHGQNLHCQQRQLSSFFYALIIILQCVHPGSHDTHPHDNRIRPIQYVYVIVSICSTSDPALLENTIEYLSYIPVKMGGGSTVQLQNVIV
jgi:hypothetical protein